MLAKACACAVVGLEGALIEVEVDIGQGLPAFSHRRPARCRRERGEGARARRDQEQRRHLPHAPHHR